MYVWETCATCVRAGISFRSYSNAKLKIITPLSLRMEIVDHKEIEMVRVKHSVPKGLVQVEVPIQHGSGILISKTRRN
jgi:hypothetical protein